MQILIFILPGTISSLNVILTKCGIALWGTNVTSYNPLEQATTSALTVPF